MKKEERFLRYKYSQGLSAWDIGCFKEPDLRVVVNDGPNGLRKPITSSFTNQSGVIKTVCTPTISALAASFDKESCYKTGELLAKECLFHGTNILLGPGVNIKRNALCGRCFEYFSEDPFLTGILASNYVNALENNGAGACIKHYACNNQEFARLVNSSEVSLRALNEIYLRSFKYILKYSSPSSIMTSYNKINGVYVNESEYLLKKKIREEYKFKGLIMSDWCAVSNKGKTFRCGLNIEMPICVRSNEYIDLGYNIDFDDNDLYQRDEETYNALKKFKNVNKLDVLDLDKLHNDTISIAEKTMILVKNDNYLPLNKSEKVLYLGYFVNHSRYVGGGSGWVNAYYAPSLNDVLDNNNSNFDFIQMYDEQNLLTNYNELITLKNKYDKVVLLLGQYDADESEGSDRKTIDLRPHQIEALKLCKKVFNDFATIVIAGSVVNIEEVYNSSKAVMISYLAGEAQAEAMYNNLYGIHNPSGRLPETWISSLSQNPIYEQLLKNDIFYSYYDDDIYVGYRYYNEFSNGFMLPFGYGLSYSKFEYSNYNLNVDEKNLNISLNIKNISNVEGEDVIQIYVSKPDSNIYRPLRELKGFDKILVKPNETKELVIKVDIDDLKVYCEETDEFVLEDGKYIVHICKNSQEVLESINVNLDGVILAKHDKPKTLTKKEYPSKVSLDTPSILMLENEIFVEELKKAGKGNYFDYHQWILYEPVRRVTYEEDLGWSFEFLEEIISKINNS